MPRFFFDFHADGKPDLDDEGEYFTGAGHARSMALRILPEILKSNDRLANCHQVCLSIRDMSGSVVGSVNMTADW